MAITWTPEEVASIKAAILALASGSRVAVIEYRGRQVSYAQTQIDDLMNLLTTADSATEGASSTNRVAAFSKGFRP